MQRFFLAALPVAVFALFLIAFTSCGGGKVDLSGGDEANGSSLYEANCRVCHGADGTGGSGPNIVGASGESVYNAIHDGPGAMPAYTDDQLSFSDIKDIYAYMQTF